MLTIFSCPKAFRADIDLIQRNAIKSWTLLLPRPDVILLGNEAGVAEICQEYHLVHLPDVQTTEFGTPLVSSIFQLAQDAASERMMCYVNSDIIIMQDFINAIEIVQSHFSKFLMVGQRYDVDISKPLDFAPMDWEVKLRNFVSCYGQLHLSTGIDYFMFPRGLCQNIPPFAVGRFVWDNWVIYNAKKMNIPVIDVTPCVMVVHQNHEVIHDLTKESSPNQILKIKFLKEKAANITLSGIEAIYFCIDQADWELNQKKLTRKSMGKIPMKNRLIVFGILHFPLFISRIVLNISRFVIRLLTFHVRDLHSEG
jgi:hypothetical protein